MNNENVHHCERCGAEIHGENFTVFDDAVLCPSCLEHYTVLCEHCGERIRRSDNVGDSHITLCRNCCDAHYTNLRAL